MKINLLKILLTVILLFISTICLKAQSQVKAEQQNIIVVGAKKTIGVAGKITYFVAKETAKIGWEVTKFTAKEVATPVAETVFLKAMPRVAKFFLKKSVPVTKKLIVTYLKL